jgi:hypothetical protein
MNQSLNHKIISELVDFNKNLDFNNKNTMRIEHPLMNTHNNKKNCNLNNNLKKNSLEQSQKKANKFRHFLLNKDYLHNNQFLQKDLFRRVLKQFKLNHSIYCKEKLKINKHKPTQEGVYLLEEKQKKLKLFMFNKFQMKFKQK